MKTAEEWARTVVNPGNDVCLHDVISIRAIQLDAYKQGMTDAAEIAVQYDSRNDTWGGGLLTATKRKILHARDNFKLP